MNYEFSDELLSAYLDDELSPEERASVDEALEADPELRRTCDELRALSNTLQAMPSSQPTSDWSEAVLQRATAVNPAQVAPTLSRRSGSNLRAWSLVAGTLATIAATVLVVVNLSRQPSDDQTRDVAQATVAQEAGKTADDAVPEASAEGDGSAAGADAMPIEFGADAESSSIHTNTPADQPASLDKVVPAIPSPAATKRQELADKQPMAVDGSRANRSNASSRTQPDAGSQRGTLDARIKSSQATFSNRPRAVKLVLRRGEDSRAALARLLQLSAAELSQLRAEDRKMVKSVASATGDQDDNASADLASAESKEKSRGLRENYEQLVLATLTPEQLAEADEVFVLPSRPGIFQQAKLLNSRQQEQSATSPASTADAFNSNSEPGSPESAQPKEHQTKAGQPTGKAGQPKGTGTGVRSPSAPTPASPQNPAPPRPLADDKDAEAAITEDADDRQSDAASLRPAANAMRKRTAQQVFRVVPKELLAKSKTLIEHESAPEPAPGKPTSTDAQPLRKAPMAIAHQPLIVIVQYEDDPETEKNLATEPTNE